MSYRDKAKQSQGSGRTFPKLDILIKLECKENPDNNKPSFKSYNKDTKKNEYRIQPIEGFYLGSANHLSCFSDNLGGGNGGNYFTNLYYSNEFAVLFEPTAKGIKKVMTGSITAIKEFLTKATANPKVRKVLFLLTEDGIIEVHTSMILSIEQLRVDAEFYIDYLMILSPIKYSTGLSYATKNVQAWLGKVVKKNPPIFAEITQGEKVTDEIATKLGIEAALDHFLLWMNHIKTNPNQVAKETVEDSKTDKLEEDIIPEGDKDGSDLPF